MPIEHNLPRGDPFEFFDEITVTGSRGGGGGTTGSGTAAGTSFGAAGDISSEGGGGGNGSASESAPIEEIVVTGAATAVATRPVSGLTRSQFNLGVRRAAELDRMFRAAAMEEITVVAQRSPTAFRGMLPFGGPLLFGADIFARIFDRLSEQRLDEAGRVATRTVPARPDTPVATIQPEVIPEIVVRARRPIPRSLPIPSFRPVNTRDFGDPRVSFPSQRPTAVPGTIAPPTTPTKARPRVRNLLLDDPIRTPTPTNRTIPRSTLLNIPRRVPGTTPRPSVPPGNLTGFGTGVLPLTQPQPIRSQNCPPCKKPKKKNRTTCYKRLVKERTNPRNDKSWKLVQINCKTGKEIPKRKK